MSGAEVTHRGLLCASPPTGTVAARRRCGATQAPRKAVWEGAVAEITQRLSGELRGYRRAV